MLIEIKQAYPHACTVVGHVSESSSTVHAYINQHMQHVAPLMSVGFSHVVLFTARIGETVPRIWLEAYVNKKVASLLF